MIALNWLIMMLGLTAMDLAKMITV